MCWGTALRLLLLTLGAVPSPSCVALRACMIQVVSAYNWRFYRRYRCKQAALTCCAARMLQKPAKQHGPRPNPQRSAHCCAVLLLL